MFQNSRLLGVSYAVYNAFGQLIGGSSSYKDAVSIVNEHELKEGYITEIKEFESVVRIIED